MSHMKLDIFIHRNNTGFNTAMTKTTVNINANIPALMRPTPTHYECCVLCMAHTCPDNRQSSCSSFTVTATSYIWVTQILNLHVETTSLMKDIPVALCFRNSFTLLLGYSVIYLGYPKYFIGYIQPF